MKYLILKLVLILPLFSFGQHLLFKDIEHQMFYFDYNNIFIDKQENGNVVICVNEQIAGLHPAEGYQTKLKMFDIDYQLIKVVEIEGVQLSKTSDMFRVGGNYMVVMLKYLEDWSTLDMRLYDNNLDFIKSEEIKLKNHDYISSYHHIYFGMSHTIGDTTMYIISYKDDIEGNRYISETIFLIDKNGIINEKEVIHNTPVTASKMWHYQKPIVNEKDSSFVILGHNKLTFDKNFNLVDKKPNPWVNIFYVNSNNRIQKYKDNYVLVNYNYDLNHSLPSFNIYSLDQNLNIIGERRVEIVKYVDENDNHFSKISPSGGFYIDENNDYNYFSSSGRVRFGNESDTVQSAFHYLKIDSSLNVKCAKIYGIIGYQHHLYDIIHTDDSILITGIMDSIEYSNINGYSSFHPFIASIRDGCFIPWAKTLYEALPMSNGELLYVKPIEVWPNPVKDVIYFDSDILKSGNKMVASIYDIQGTQVVKDIPVIDHYIDVAGLMSGAYYLQIHDVKENRSWGSKFIVGE